ncbi:acyl-CoA N-acyltransferase [Choanephora cucurbitarum]|nr:acyl-CoA N-acyltransferase [Choanephora cucurbitarum]
MVQPATIFVRKALPSDIKYVQEATKTVNAAYRSEGGWTTEKDIVGGLRCTEEDMKHFVEESGQPNTLLFAFDEETVVGTLQIQPMKSEEKEAEIGLLSVSPLYQSRGIGGKLIRQALIEMQQLGFTFAVMHVLENRPEILSWYRKLGFSETGERIPFVWPEMLKVDEDLHFLTLKKPI